MVFGYITVQRIFFCDFIIISFISPFVGLLCLSFKNLVFLSTNKKKKSKKKNFNDFYLKSQKKNYSIKGEGINATIYK